MPKMKTISKPQIKGLPKIIDCGEITPGFDDTAGGEKINNSSVAMGSHAGKCTIYHGVKTHEVRIIHNFGASITLNGPKRSFHLNLRWLIDQAVSAGLLDETMEFEPLKESK